MGQQLQNVSYPVNITSASAGGKKRVKEEDQKITSLSTLRAYQKRHTVHTPSGQYLEAAPLYGKIAE